MNLEFGNAWEQSTVSPAGDKTGWFVGNFPEIKANGYRGPRINSDAEIKWYEHPRGQESGFRPISQGHTLSILVKGEFGLWFCEPDDHGHPDENWKQFILRNKGDYLICATASSTSGGPSNHRSSSVFETSPKLAD